MKLIGNSVSVPVIEMIGKAILDTGVFDGDYKLISNIEKKSDQVNTKSILQI